MTNTSIHTRGGFLLLIMLLLCLKAVAQQNFVVRNNLLYDAALTPNIGFDVRLNDHWSLGANAGFRPWPTDDDKTKKWRHLLLAPELRHWSDSTFKPRSSYWGLNLIYSHYNVGDVKFPLGLYKTVRDYRMQGDLAAIGAFYGYTWRLSKWLRLEAEAGLGVGYAWAKKFDCAHCGTEYGHDDKPFLVPKLALNIVLDRQKQQPAPQVPVIPDIPTPIVRPTLVYHHVVPATVGDHLMADNPVLAEYKDYRPYDKTRILRKEKGMLYVHFPLGKATLQRDFRDNALTLDRITDITRQIMADSKSTVRLIQIIGLASVDGAVALNDQLAQERAEALRDYIKQQVPEATDQLFELANGGEAWTELRDQISDVVLGGQDVPSSANAAGGEKALRQALDIIDSEPNLDRREQRLRQLNGGRTYQFLREDLLPDQRNSGYLRIYFDRVPDKQAETINRASDLLSQEKYDEALSLLNKVRDDSRSWNALGVALYMTGNQEQALDYFRRAAQDGNTDATENLKRLEE